jgi:hypothetical protein
MLDNGFRPAFTYGYETGQTEHGRGQAEEPSAHFRLNQAAARILCTFMPYYIRWFFLERGCSIKFPDSIELSAPPFIILLALVGYIASVIWVSRDARKRGKSGFFAGFFAAIALWPVSLIFWLWLRPRPTSKI